MVKLAIIGGVIVAMGFAAIVLAPGPKPPVVSIKLAGYTNDASGVRLAIISITNPATANIFMYLPRVEIPASAEAGGIASYGKPNHWHSMFAESGSETFTIPVPTNGSPWRLSFLVYNDLGTVQSLRRFVRGRRMPFDVQSGWFYDDK